MNDATLKDIEWAEHLDDALARAKQLRRAIVVKPLGQGVGFEDDW